MVQPSRSWWDALNEFVKREWFSVFAYGGLGSILATIGRLILQDHSFRRFLISKYSPQPSHFDNPRVYMPYAVTVAAAIFLAVALRIPANVKRGLRSWWEGVTSGLALLSFASMLVLMSLPSPTLTMRLILATSFIFLSFVASFRLHLQAQVRPSLSERDLRVPSAKRVLANTQISESDDPIQTWSEDMLGRASLVDSISLKLMISKAPVIAVLGPFGAGKTSILNLLREHLQDKAIVVSFSTWLPGSQETLTTYLLGDLANECQKMYFVPGLRKGSQRLARAVGRNTPFLKTYLELLPAATQRDDIASLRTALQRLPKRVIVLLDELDRMEKDELLTLFKVIRGASTLPNVSFVCAFDQPTIEKIAEKEHSYFEKFFPVSFQVPAIDPDALKKAGVERLIDALNKRRWFKEDSESEAFRKQIDSVWDARIAPFCTNLRAIGLLANDVGAAAALVRGEVHPLDLTLIEMVRRFRPEIYEIIAKNFEALTGGESVLRGGHFRLDKEKEVIQGKLRDQIQRAVPDTDERARVNGVIGELFPSFTDKTLGWIGEREKRTESEELNEKRISSPRIFPAYFQYELPQAIFSSIEMEALFERMRVGGEAAQNAFLETLGSMEKGSLKRDDFLRQISFAAKQPMPTEMSRAIVLAAMRSADKLVYDHAFIAFSEAGHVLRLVLSVTQQTSPSDRFKLLSDCILIAADDTMALRVLRYLTGKHEDWDLGISLADLYPSFRQRMRKRYGKDVDAVNLDLATSDPWAFDFWGSDLSNQGIPLDPEDRKVQGEFWLRYIGRSRSRLARAFKQFFLPVAIYSSDVAPIVEHKIPIADLERLFKDLSDTGDLTSEDRISLKTLEHLLNGEFKDGVNPMDRNLYVDEDAASA